MQIGSPSWRELLRAGAQSMGIVLDPERIERFSRHATELVNWNRKINLTAITDPAEVAVRHFLDSIVPDPLIPAGAALLDIGSGGGFPGIALKVLRPDLKVTLIDSVRKKVNFQKHVIRCLGLDGIRSEQVRAEDLPRGGSFDVIVSRALSDLTRFVGLALPLLAAGGLMIALKGEPAEAQLEADDLTSARSRGGAGGAGLKTELIPYRLPGVPGERTIVVVRRENAGHRTSNVRF